ncbi:MAG: TA system VapC family ribonuclease toxin [Vicinamibacterales bacterium]
MILVDANLLVYAHDASAAEHPRARDWFVRVINEPGRVGIPWPSLLAFVRLVSNPAVVRAPVSVQAAWARVAQWLERDNVWIPLPGTDHPPLLAALLADATITSRMVPDAHLAALAIEHGLTLCSTDSDFSRFADLRWHNPLNTKGPRA